MFESVTIQNFRGIKHLEIPKLGKINVLVGDNGVGKTSVLDLLYMIINPNNSRLPFQTNLFREMTVVDEDFWRSYFWNFRFENKIKIQTEGEAYHKRSVEISAKRSGIDTIITEDFEGAKKVNSDKPNKVTGLHASFRVSDSKLYSAFIQQGEKGVELIADKDYVELLEGNYFNNVTIGKNDDIALHLRDVITSKKKLDLIGYLQKFESSIKDINILPGNRIVVEDEKFERTPDIGTYGGGFLRAVHIFTTVLAKNKGIALFDEIENGLHVSRQSLIWRAIFEVVKQQPEKQMFVATHSKEMLHSFYEVVKENNALADVRLYHLKKKDGNVQVMTFESNQLEYSLSHDLEVR